MNWVVQHTMIINGQDFQSKKPRKNILVNVRGYDGNHDQLMT